MREWQCIVPKRDREVYRLGGYGRRLPFGKHPALLLVDITYAFTGSKPMRLADAIREFPSSCGHRAWKVLPSVRQLLNRCRAKGIPVIYTTGDPTFAKTGLRTTKAIRVFSRSALDPNGFVEVIAPREQDLILRKAMASAFFGTPLATYLCLKNVDSLLLAGGSTSGCVRATAVDAHSHGFAVFPVEECCFDRSEFSHLANLFEINSRYGTVITLREALRWVSQS